MTDEEKPWNERSVMGNQRVFAHLHCYEMDYSHTYIFIPKTLEDRVEEVLHFVFEEPVEAYMIYIVNCTSDTPSNLW